MKVLVGMVLVSLLFGGTIAQDQPQGHSRLKRTLHKFHKVLSGGGGCSSCGGGGNHAGGGGGGGGGYGGVQHVLAVPIYVAQVQPQYYVQPHYYPVQGQTHYPVQGQTHYPVQGQTYYPVQGQTHGSSQKHENCEKHGNSKNTAIAIASSGGKKK